MSFRAAQRKEKILEELISHSGYLTSRCLSEKFNVSSRTIREDMRQLSGQLQAEGIELSAVPSRGYRLPQNGREKAAAYLETLRQPLDDIPGLPADRLRYILRELLFGRGSIHPDDLADALYVSRSTVDKDINLARVWLAAHELTLIARKSHGLFLQGNELALRYTMLDFFWKFHSLPDLSDLAVIQDTIGQQSVEPIKEIIFNLNGKQGLELSDADFLNLLIYLAVSVVRISAGKVIEEIDTAFSPPPCDQASQLAAVIADQVEAAFPIHFSPAEAASLAGCLLQVDVHPQVPREAPAEKTGGPIAALLAEALWEIRARFQLDFSRDEALTCGLAAYLDTLVNRKEFSTFARKPGLEGIIREYPDALEMAVTVSGKLKGEYGISTGDEEIWNMALYFCAAIERSKETSSDLKRKVVIICATGSAGSQLLAVKVRHGFPDIHIIGVYPVYRLQEALKQKPDLVLSTIPLKGVNCPVVQINHLVGNQDQAHIREAIGAIDANAEGVDLDELFHSELFFTGIKAKDKEELIRWMCDEIRKRGYAGGDFARAVLDRESIFPTDIGNLVAIPHAIGTDIQRSWIAVGILDEPLEWGGDPAQLILLLNMTASAQDEFKRIYEKLYQMVGRKKNIEKLIRSKDFNEFIKVMHA